MKISITKTNFYLKIMKSFPNFDLIPLFYPQRDLWVQFQALETKLRVIYIWLKPKT